MSRENKPRDQGSSKHTPDHAYPEAKTVGEATAIQLRVAIPLGIVLIGAAFTLGTYISGVRDTSRLAVENEQLRQKVASSAGVIRQQANQIIGNLGTSDDAVRSLIKESAEAIDATELSIHYNTRGSRIYDSERELAASRRNVFRKSEVKRALEWFEESAKANPVAPLPRWNAACMYALLGDAGEAVKSLATLKPLIPTSESDHYMKRLCEDTDLCVIDHSPEFKAFMTGVDCKGATRLCPNPRVEAQ